MIRYLSLAEFAARIGVQRSALARYRLPEPDAMIGATRGWLPDTIDTWNARRPGPGRRKTAGDWVTPQPRVTIEFVEADTEQDT